MEIVRTLSSPPIDGSASTRAYPPVNIDMPKDIMATTGCPHEIFPSDDRICFSKIASRIVTGVDDILRCSRASTADLDIPKPEESLARLVYEGQRYRESLKQIHRDVSSQPLPPNETGAELNEIMDHETGAELNEIVDQKLSELFEQPFVKMKLNNIMDGKLSETKNTVTAIEKKLSDLKDELAELQDNVYDLNDELNEDIDEFAEPNIALEDQLRITEQSAKAIGLLSDHLLSTVWQTCSKNTYGFFIRIMLLSGSSFKKQLIPDTNSLVFISLLGVFFSAAMQIILAWYLWTRLPPTYPAENGDNSTLKVYPGTDGGRSYYDSPFGFARVALPAYQYPNYKYANDVCRTAPLVQLVTIGLFLFSILNNVPGVLKNVAIIWFSDRFVSVDEEGITKLHYWRESSYMRESADEFVQFLNEKFKDLFQNEKIKKNAKILYDGIKSFSMSSDIPLGTPDTVLENLRVKADVRDPCAQEKSDEEEELKAFICEMFLRGCIIPDSKKKKIINEKLKKQINEKLSKGQMDKTGDNEPSPEEHDKQNLVNLFASHVLSQREELTSFSKAALRRWMLPGCFVEILPKKFPWNLRGRWTFSRGGIPRSFFEVCETRSFVAEALRLIDVQNNTRQVGLDKNHVPVKENIIHKIVRDNCPVWPLPIEIKPGSQPIQFCDKVRLNLVRIDYLKPSKWSRPMAYRWLKDTEKEEDLNEMHPLSEALGYLKLEMSAIEEQKAKVLTFLKNDLGSLQQKLTQIEETNGTVKMDDAHEKVTSKVMLLQNLEKLKEDCSEKTIALKNAIYSHITETKLKDEKNRRAGCFKFRRIYEFLCCAGFRSKPDNQDIKFMSLLRKSLGSDFADVLSAVSFSHKFPSGMGRFRFFAFVLGVLPEVVSLLIMAVTGVQYILWSGFKVGSDTQGMEEIILATLAINFIYEIDDAVYDHVFPELYKEAHERDKFDITGFWISSETAAILKKCKDPISWWYRCFSWDTNKTGHSKSVKDSKEEEDCLKTLSKCDPIKWQSNSKSPLAPSGYFLGVDISQENLSGESANAQKTPKVAGKLTGLIGYVSPQAHMEHGKDNQTLEEKKKLNSEEKESLENLLKYSKLISTVHDTEKGKEMIKLNEYIQRLDVLSQKNRTNDSDTFQASEDLEATWNSTKDRRLEELQTYEERWSKPFNDTILYDKKLTSHWGEKPFVRAMKMSVSDHWNDIYLAHAYPFLYARKLRYAFASHLWESFLILYGKLGLHLFALTSLTITIVAGYRVLAQCHRFAPEGSLLGIFSRQAWPSTCLLNVGQPFRSFADLEGQEGMPEDFMAVSCGPSGYVPDQDEWVKNRNYFTDPPP